MGTVNCNLLRQLLEAENPRIYIFDRQGQRLIATLRVTWRFSRDRDGTPRIGFPVDLVMHDYNTVWNERARQFGNNIILRLRTLYPHELLQLAEWLRQYAQLVETYVMYCLDGAQQEQARTSAPPPPPAPPSKPQQVQGEEGDLGDLEQL